MKAAEHAAGLADGNDLGVGGGIVGGGFSDSNLQCERNARNRAVPHHAVRRIYLKKILVQYELCYEYLDPRGSTVKFHATVRPPPELVRLERKSGMGRGSIIRDYVRRAQYLLDGTLPREVVKRCEWGP